MKIKNLLTKLSNAENVNVPVYIAGRDGKSLEVISCITLVDKNSGNPSGFLIVPYYDEEEITPELKSTNENVLDKYQIEEPKQKNKKSLLKENYDSN